MNRDISNGLLFLAAVVVAFLVIRLAGAVPALALATCGLAAHLLVRRARAKAEEARKWNSHADDLWVVDTDDMGNAPNIDRVAEFVVAAKDPEKEAERLRGLLQENRNPYFLGRNPDGQPLPRPFRIHVETMRFRHGVYRTETWEEYEARIVAVVSTEVNDRHGAMAGDTGETVQKAKEGGKIVAHEWSKGTYKAIREGDGDSA